MEFAILPLCVVQQRVMKELKEQKDEFHSFLQNNYRKALEKCALAEQSGDPAKMFCIYGIIVTLIWDYFN